MAAYASAAAAGSSPFNPSYLFHPFNPRHLMKYTGPKARVVRSLGVNVFGSDKYDKILQKKSYGPGKSPKARAGRKSEYAQQLMEKQKMRMSYGLTEKQFRRTYDEATAVKGKPTADVMRQLLERRLDNAIYRAGFSMTRMQARQFASHGLFMVNGRRVTVPSYRVREGDSITVRPSMKSSPAFPAILESHDKYMPPQWLKVNSSAMAIDVVAMPDPEGAEQVADMRQIIEFYSRN